MSEKLNILIAYPYMNKSVVSYVAGRSDIRFLLDSGAFTSWKTGNPIKLDDYCNFIEKLPFKPWNYFTLDVIGDAKGTMENYQTMLSRGFSPIPIFTRGEDPSVLDDYYKTSEIVGIGGLVGTRGNKGFVNAIMKRVQKRKVHLLGFTNLPFLKFHRPFSCDSSNWASGLRFGNTSLYLGKGQPVIGLSKLRILEQLKDPKIRVAIQGLGFDPDSLRVKDNWRNIKGSTTKKLGARSWKKLSMDVEKNLGTLLFLASATVTDMQIFLEEY